MQSTGERRSSKRLLDSEWTSTVNRIRAEFDEMPCLRVTMGQAQSLFGLSQLLSQWVLDCLSREGFLESRNGEYMRRQPEP
jgi:hypothetical protein